MKAIINQNGDVIEVKIEGRLDTITAPEFESTVEQIMALKTSTINVECSSLSYVSSSGLRSLLKLLKGVNANGGTLTLQNLSAEIKEVFDITGFSALFNIN